MADKKFGNAVLLPADGTSPLHAVTKQQMEAADATKQPLDQDLTDFAAISPTNDDIVQRKSGVWVARSMTQLKTDLVLVKGDVGLGSVTNDAQVKLSTATTKGDLYVATGSATVVRQAVGGNNDPLIADSAQTNGIRYDLTRGSDLGWTREALGFLCTNNLGVPSGSSGAATLAQTSTTRTIQFLIGKLPNSTSIGTIKLWTAAAMVGGAASIALYGSTTLNSSSWSRLGSNVTITSTLQAAAGRQSITYSTTTTGDQWIRAEIVLTTAPSSTYPTYFVGTLPLVNTVVGGHLFGGTQNATAAPGSTLDPSTSWTDAFPPALALTA